MRKIKSKGFTLIELLLALSAIFICSISIYYIYDMSISKNKVSSTVDQIMEINKTMSSLKVLNIDISSARQELLKNNSMRIPIKNNNEFINEWKGKITINERIGEPNYYNLGYYNIPKSECINVVQNSRRIYDKVESSNGKIVDTNDISKIMELCGEIDKSKGTNALIFSDYYYENGAFTASVSNSTENSNSVSNSISTSLSGSVSRSNSISTSNSTSNSISASNSISKSNSIVASNSVANSLSVSSSVSNSISNSISNSVSTSRSLSNSVLLPAHQYQTVLLQVLRSQIA